MHTTLLALAVLLSANPQGPSGKPPSGPFEGRLVYTVESSAGGSARSTGQLKLTLSSQGLRLESTFNNNGRMMKNTTLVTGNPPVLKGWNDQQKKFLPMQPPASQPKGAIKAELLGEDTQLGLKTVHVRILDGAEAVEFWTAPGLVSDVQMSWIFASSRVPTAVVDELKRLGAWGPVVRSKRDQVITQLEKVERASVDPAQFTDAATPTR